VGAGGAESHGPEDAGHEADIVVHQLALADLVLLAQRLDHVQAQDIGLALFHGRGLLLESLAHRALAIDGVLDAQAVRHLVEHGVLEKGVEGDVLALVLGDELPGDGHQDLVELGAHGVLELQAPGTLLQLHPLVVGQVDGDGLGAGVGVARVVDRVVGVELGVRPGLFLLVLVGYRKSGLQLRHEIGEPGQALAPLHVLDQDKRLESGLVAVELVLVGLDGAEDQVDGIVLHGHPGHVAFQVFAGQQGVGTQLQIVRESIVVSQFRRFPQQFRRPLQGFGEKLVVGNGFQLAFLVPPDHGVERRLTLGVRGLELLLGHGVGIEIRAGGLGADALDEGLVGIQPIPGTVVDAREPPRGIVVDLILQQVLARPVGLAPEQVVHDLGSVDQLRKHGALVLAQVAQVGRELHRRVDAEALSHVGLALALSLCLELLGGRRLFLRGRRSGHFFLLRGLLAAATGGQQQRQKRRAQ